jgi:4a-hydroxytetrahydrobiopterin dehydratase
MKKFTEKKSESSDWLEKDSLTKKFEFRDFKQALDFINKISEESEKLNHHPDIKWNYNKIEIKLKTHDKNKITELDYKLSKKIDKIYKELKQND